MNKSVIAFGILILAVIAIVAWQAQAFDKGYDFRDNMAVAAASTITALLAVTLFVERAMAGVNAIVFGDAQRIAERQLIEGTKTALSTLSNVLGVKERVRLFGSFLAGLFVSAAGIRTIEGLVQAGTADPPSNSFLIPVDIILTAALIAGGSNGLAFLLQLAKDTLTDRAPTTSNGAVAENAPAKSMELKNIRARLVTTG